MRKTDVIYVLLWLLLFPKPSLSQSLTFDHITIDKGLSSNTIYSIVEGHDGFLWFGSRDGLHRYDGYEFRIFKSEKENSRSLPGNNVQALFCRENGDLWIGLKGGGLAIFERESQQFKANPFEGEVFPDWREVSVQAIFQDSYGGYWIGTGGQGIVHIDSGLQQFEHFISNVDEAEHLMSSDFCFSFAEDDSGNIWMGTYGNGVHYYNRQRQTIEELPGDEAGDINLYSYSKALLHRNGRLWIGTEGHGLYIYDIDKGAFVRKALGKALIKDIALDQSERVLISTDGAGLFVSNDDGASFQNFRFSPNITSSLNTNALYDIYVDRSGNVWIGSFNGGVNVYKIHKADFLTFSQATSQVSTPGDQSVLALCEDSDNKIWIGKDGGGLSWLDPKTQEYRNYEHTPDAPYGISGDVVTAIRESSNGSLWVGTFNNGLNRFDPQTKRFYTFREEPGNTNSLSNNNVWAIEEAPAGGLWIGTLGGGLNHFNPVSKRFTRYQPDIEDPHALSDYNIQALLVDSKNNLWIGTEYGGLNKLPAGSEQFISWEQGEEGDSLGLKSNSVLCIYESRDGSIWLGTEGGGLHRLLEGEQGFQNYSVRDGLPSNVVNSIEEDSSGKLWLSTNLGLSAFNPETGSFSNYDKNDGLQSNQFNRGASLAAHDGAMYFGGISGLNIFHPQSLEKNTNPPKVAFTAFKLFNKPVPVGKYNGRVLLPEPLNDEPTLRLRYADNVFTIEFAALEFTNPIKNKYAYKLEGFEESWNYVDASQRLATYTNLDAGNYTFKVKASNNSGVWNEEDIQMLHIVITPPVWKTWWFRLLLVLFFFGLLLTYIHIQNRRRAAEHQRQLLKAEQEILMLKNEKLGQEVDRKNAQLSAALLQSAHKNNSLNELKKQLAELSQQGDAEPKRKREIRRLVRKIDSELDSEDYWEQFQLSFDQVHQQFSHKLHEHHPQLSPNDIRLCCLLRISMTNREIASIQNISLGAVEKSKYRLKKKLGLDKEDDLNLYIMEFA